MSATGAPDGLTAKDVLHHLEGDVLLLGDAFDEWDRRRIRALLHEAHRRLETLENMFAAMQTERPGP